MANSTSSRRRSAAVVVVAVVVVAAVAGGRSKYVSIEVSVVVGEMLRAGSKIDSSCT